MSFESSSRFQKSMLAAVNDDHGEINPPTELIELFMYVDGTLTPMVSAILNLDASFATLTDTLTALGVDVGDLEGPSGTIATINARLTALESHVSSIASAVTDLTTRLDGIVDYMDTQLGNKLAALL